MSRVLFTLVLLSLLSPRLVLSQELPQVVPPAPEAAGINKYIDIPVGHYSGTAQVSIPLLQAQSRDISVPVSISYHGAGVRIDEMASRIGLGWSIMAGGSISRTVRGKPDDRASTGYLNTSATVSAFISAHDNNASNLSQLANAAIGTNAVDYEPDLFSFSFMGHSGKFVFQQDGTVVTIPHSDYKIVKRSTANDIEGWTITDPNGYQYHFGNLPVGTATARAKSEIVSSYTLENPTVDVDFGADFYSSWHLLKVESPSSDAEVTFNYSAHTYNVLSRGGQTVQWGIAGGTCSHYSTSEKTSMTDTEYTDVLLSSIDFENGSIDFSYSTSRDDAEGDVALESVTLKDDGDQQVRRFELVQDYFVSDYVATETPTAITVNSQATHRLRLQKIIEKGVDNTEPKEHVFDYYYSPTGLKLPHRFSMRQDFWGFYNGASLNTSLIPSYYNLQMGITRPGADRRVNAAYSYANALKSITYPTGGKATFNYESNSVINAEQSLNSFFPLETVNLKSHYYTGSGSSTLTGNFTVTADHIGGYIEYEVERTGCTDPINSFTCGAYMEITGVTDPGFQMYLTAESGHFTLPEGEYQLEFDVVGTNITAAEVHLRAFENASPVNGESLVGGIRVKDILLEDGNGNTIRKKLDYTDPDTGLTSGKLASTNLTFVEKGILFCSDVQTNNPTANQLTSYSPVPMLSAGSSHVGYTHVTEYQFADKQFYDHSTASNFTKEIKNGFTRYQFSFVYDDTNGSESYPFAPFVTYDWKKGNLEQKEVYSSDRGYAEQLSAETIDQKYYDDVADPHWKQVKGVRFGKRGLQVDYRIYSTVSEVFNVEEQKVSQFFEGEKLEVTTTNHYDNNDYLRPSKTVSTNSQGKTTINKMYYPRDKALISGLTAAQQTTLDNMVSDNLLGTPILTESFVNSETNPVAKQMTTFVEASTGRYHPDIMKIWNRDTDLFEDRVSFTFDTKGNYELVTKEPGQIIGYVWGYNETRPIAQLSNAEAAEVFLQDFEETEGNATADPHTGKNYYSGDYSLTFTPAAGKAYILSYWYLDGSTWKLHTQDYTGTSATLSLGTAIDDVRIYPKDAQVMTMTYDPLIGMTSQSGPNHYPVRYFYDSHNRIQHIKDHEGNIVQAFDYAYQTTTSN